MSQTVWIARHANRLDFVNPDWFLTAERRYDPPLSEDGIVQAQQLARRLKPENIAHIFASPFCEQYKRRMQSQKCSIYPLNWKQA